MNLTEQYRQLGEKWLNGFKIDEIDLRGKKFIFNEIQSSFINDLKTRYCLNSGGYGSGKSLALYIKLILFLICFPNNRILLGRKNLADIDRVILPDLFELMPKNWFKHRVKDGVLNFFNGSQIVLFGLDALQTGSMSDIKKAQQKLKSLNLGAYFIDQLEEVEFDVFESLNSRLRRTDVPLRQGNMTCNPANFWAYDWFKAHPREGTALFQSSMLDNKENLPEDYLEDQLRKDEQYVKRFVLGQWTPDVLLNTCVFTTDQVKRFEGFLKKPLRIDRGCEIFEEPDPKISYQIGVDASEGVIDPASVSVVSFTGRKVAKFNGFISIPGLIEIVKFLYFKYNKGLIIPEAMGAGTALLEGIKDLRVYIRTVFEEREDRETEKLGFKTNYATKKALIAHFQKLLDAGFPVIFDENTINEFKTFIWSDSVRLKGAGAERGFHDDDVMSTLLAFWGLNPLNQNAMRKELKSYRQPIKTKSFV